MGTQSISQTSTPQTQDNKDILHITKVIYDKVIDDEEKTKLFNEVADGEAGTCKECEEKLVMSIAELMRSEFETVTVEEEEEIIAQYAENPENPDLKMQSEDESNEQQSQNKKSKDTKNLNFDDLAKIAVNNDLFGDATDLL